MTMCERSYGYKYGEQKGKTTAEIAALMRKDIKQAVQHGLLPGAPIKYSVRTHTYSGGASINITVENMPEAWKTCDGEVFDRHDGRKRHCTNEWCSAAGEHKDLPGAAPHLVLSELGSATEMTLDRIHQAYNHDGSDSMVDHFDVNYYGSVTIEKASDSEWRQRESGKAKARRAAIDEQAKQETHRVVVYGSQGKRTVHDAVEVDGRIKLVCGGQLSRSSVVGKAEGCDLTCSRCVKRASK